MKKLKVWWIPQIPMESFDVEVQSIEEGVKIIEILADYDNFQLKNNIKGDYCNTGGIQRFEPAEGWVDVDLEEEKRND